MLAHSTICTRVADLCTPVAIDPCTLVGIALAQLVWLDGNLHELHTSPLKVHVFSLRYS